MKGLLYKDFFLLKNGLLFAAIFQAVISGVCIFIAIPSIGFSTEISILMMAACYYLSFMILAIINQELFALDENRSWGSFIISTPQTAKGQVASKYYMILIENIILLFCCFLTDVIVTCVAGDVMVTAIIACMFIFCLRILIHAIEIPFLLLFGSRVGGSVKSVLLVLLFFILLCYGLFGDISFLFGDDPAAAFLAFMNSGNIIWVGAIFPYAAAVLYVLSYHISVRLYQEVDYGE